MSSHKTYI